MDMVTYDLIGSAYSELEGKEEWLDNVESVADIAISVLRHMLVI